MWMNFKKLLIISCYLFITRSSFVCTYLLATLRLIVQYGSLIRIWPDSPLLCESGLCYWCCLTLSPALSIAVLYPGQHDVHRCGGHYIVSQERSRCESWLQFQEECMKGKCCLGTPSGAARLLVGVCGFLLSFTAVIVSKTQRTKLTEFRDLFNRQDTKMCMQMNLSRC